MTLDELGMEITKKDISDGDDYLKFEARKIPWPPFY